MIQVMRPANYDPKKIKFPVWAQPKIDGVRAFNPEGTLLARTLKQHKNRHVTEYYSQKQFIGLDGELAAQGETHPDLCRITSSALSRIEGQPYTQWHLFDWLTPNTIHLPYRLRYELLQQRVKIIDDNRLRVVPYTPCDNLEELMTTHEWNMQSGYEGTCFYGPDVIHKEGKSSPNHNGVLRIKDFVDTEVIVEDIIEGRHNMNDALVNERGLQYRTSHQDNQVPNGMIGSLTCRALATVTDLYDKKKILIEKDQIFTVAPGNMTDAEAKLFFEQPQLIVGKISKIKFFPKGIKDAPRFPQWQCLRSKEDL
jgi:DNA ligase-1